MLDHDPTLRARFPHLGVATVRLSLTPPTVTALAALDLSDLHCRARSLVANAPESELESIRAWRAAFAAMGLKPTKYRCAAEALLRRMRTTGDLPRINPLVDLANAVSAATALPIAALDLDHVHGRLRVAPATGTEVYHAFDSSIEHPDPGEIVFVDEAGVAHARRWTHRQSARSAVTEQTREVLVVCEGQHESAAADTAAAVAELLGRIPAAPAR